MRLSPVLLAWTALVGLPIACQGPHSQDPGPQNPDPGSGLTQGPTAESLKESVGQVSTALANLNFKGARKIIDSMEFERLVASAQESLAKGEPRLAIRPLEQAMDLKANDPNTLYLRGQAAYEAAPNDSQPGFFYGDACSFLRQSYEAGVRAKGAPGADEFRALVYASRAAHRMPDAQQALDLARLAGRVQKKLHTDGIPLPVLTDPLEKVWAEASFARYIELKRSGEDAAEALVDAENKLRSYAGRRPLDPWGFKNMSNLYLWDQRPKDARSQLELALELAPEDESLFDQYFSLNWRNFGWEETVTKMEKVSAQFPAAAIGHWYVGMSYFYRGLELFEAGAADTDPEMFDSASKAFAKSRELRATFEANALAYEASCLSATAWIQYHRDELIEAEKTFRSMEGLFERGMKAAPETRMPSGVVGLAFLAQKYHAKGQTDVEALEQAAAIGDFLFDYDPEDSNLANNAGFLNRDAAVLHGRIGSEMARRAAQAEGAAERGNLLRSSAQEQARAQVLMERSYAAYQVAAELAPDDIRICNDAGLIMTYYLRTDPEQAEVYLRQSIANAEDQEIWNSPETDAYEAWGDAYQNLAVLYLTAKNDPARAKTFLTKSLEIGPEYREGQRSMLEIFDRLIAGEDVGNGSFAQMIWSAPAK
ncbi:MAG: tetratricopeptide (TPR) repeat protein [Planctomycetota bacterium]|jgi:tetratricopeptide (TPR) repeat protein